MKVILESTTRVVNLDGMPCRIWEGETSGGVKCHAYIPRIAAESDQDLSQFETELEEKRRPSPEVAAIPLRMLL